MMNYSNCLQSSTFQILICYICAFPLWWFIKLRPSKLSLTLVHLWRFCCSAVPTAKPLAPVRVEKGGPIRREHKYYSVMTLFREPFQRYLWSTAMFSWTETWAGIESGNLRRLRKRIFHWQTFSLMSAPYGCKVSLIWSWGSSNIRKRGLKFRLFSFILCLMVFACNTSD